ncbi:invasin domain 3-containing protein [Escherichia fergusonii]|uniref:invasin domain 3-containing protein n=1 Tax=Escherichia fergusonii TaxID=564 RepID=UPI003BACA1B1
MSHSPLASFRSPRLARAVTVFCILTQSVFPLVTSAATAVHVANGRPTTVPGYSSARSAAGTDWLTDEDQDTTAGWVAGLAADAGGLLSSGISGRQAVDMARSHATGAAQTAVQDWLSQWGTARVTLGSGEHFSMKDVGLDLLLPWYDTPDNLFFTQHSLHRTDDRTQLNTGAGWRHFAGDQMVGVNLFYDHDLTRYHSRLGLGGEYWRDYLKLSGNGYLRLSSWRSAPELDHDYEARPANGWDLRAEGYLPAWPQLGGKVMVEKYYGDEVALFGKDNRQKDPYAVTAGLSWTPVPLVSFSAEQKQGGSGKHDTRFGMALTYTPGVSLSVQLDPNAVAVRRSLAGSRQDLVDRNNNIVLEYRRKILVKLGLLDPVTGEGGEAKPLVASLQTKYALKTLYAEAAGLTAAGGGLRTEGAQVTVTLPVYRQTATPEIDNSYRVAVVAEDVKGNRSGTEETTVVVRAPQVSSEQSSVTTDLSQVKPDGAEKATLTYVARDDRGMVVSGLSVTARVTTVPADGMQVTLGTFTETKTPGTYTAELTAKTAGAVTVMPQVNNRDAAKAAVTVTVTEKMPVAEHSRITLSGTVGHERSGEMNFRAGDRVTVTVTLQDGNQNAVTGQTALLTAEAVNVPGMVLTDGSAWTEADVGVYTTVWQAQKVGIGHVAGLQVSGWGEAKKSESYNIEAGDIDPLKSEVSVSPSVIVADGSAQATVTYVAVDTHGNAVSGLTAPGLSISGVPDTTFSGFMESGTKGTYTGVLTSGTTAGEATLMPQAGGQDMAKAAATLTLVAGDVDPLKSEVSVSPSVIVADGSAQATVTYVAVDTHGNAVSGLTAPGLSISGVPDTTFSGFMESGTKGTYTGVLTSGTTAGEATLMPQAGGQDMAKAAATLTLVAGDVDPLKSEVSVSPSVIVADGSAQATVTYVAVDTHGNAVSGLTAPGLSISGVPDTTFSGFMESGTKGTYTGVLTSGTTAGEATLMPQAGGQDMAKAAATLTLVAGDVDPLKSEVSVSPSVIVADGSAQATVTYVAVDTHGNAVSGLTAPGLSISGVPDTTFSGFMESGTKGTYTGVLTSGTTAGEATLMPQAGGQDMAKAAATLTLVAGDVDPLKSEVSVSPSVIVADGSAQATVTYVAVDTHGNAVSGLTAPGLSISGVPDTTFSGFMESGTKGTYTGVLTSGTTAGEATLMPQAGGQDMAKAAATLTLVAGDVDPLKSEVSVSPSVIVADGSAQATVTYVAVDTHGNAVSGLTAPGLSISGVPDTTFSGFMESGTKGTYTGVLTSGTTAGEATLMPQAGGQDMAKAAATLTLVAGDVDPLKSEVSVSPSVIVADGSAQATVTYVAVDTHGNAVSGLTAPGLSISGVPDTTFSGFMESGTKGTYTGVLTSGTTAGEATLMPQAGGQDMAKAAATLTLVAGDVDPLKSEVSVSPSVIVADGSAQATVTYVAVDTHGNAVSGLTAPGLSISGVPDTTFSGFMESGTKGTYTGVLTSGTTAGEATLMPQAGGQDMAKAAATLTLVAGDVDPLKSEVSVSPSVIVADGSAQATVTYVAVDTHGNAVSGLTAPGLSISGVPDTTFSGFMESGTKGTYTGVLTSGTTAGEATLMPQAGGQDMAKAAATLTLVAGEPVAGNSEISLSAEDGSEQAGEVIFRGGDRVTVTVTLKDKTQNTVTGRAALLYHSVDLPAVRILDGNQWEENLPGIYTIVGQALHTGDGYVASLQLSDWDVAKKSEAYTIVAGTPDAVKSSIHVNTELYYTGDVMELTVILQDKVNNTVSGMADKLFDVVRVDGAGDYVPEGDFAWKESEVQPGLYHANYVALVAPREFTRSQLCWNGWDDCAISNGYSTEESKITKLVIGPDPENGFSPDQGFPKTGFSGASFKVQINGGTPSGWVFKTDSGWASVDNDGVVTFKANGEAGTQVTVTASRGPVELSYKFTLNAWLYMASESKVSWHGAIEICEGRGDEIASLETLSTVSTIFERQKFDVRSVGNLFGEWAFPGYYGTDYGLTKLGDMLYAGAKVWPGFPTWMAPTLELMASREELEANFKEASISTAFPICMRRASNGR